MSTPIKQAGAVVGVIETLKGLTVEVTILGERPDVKELLIIENHPEIFLEVSLFKGGKAVCINLANSTELRCGQKVFRSHTKVTVPVGPKTLGRVFNALGEPLDDAPGVTENRKAIAEPTGTKSYRSSAKLELLETGLKVIDFLTPFVKGRKIGIVGGAGVGKTVLTTEMIHNVSRSDKSLSIYCGVGERIREVTNSTRPCATPTCSKTPSCSSDRWTVRRLSAPWWRQPQLLPLSTSAMRKAATFCFSSTTSIVTSKR
jgi:F-type H+-transporting ATPase subunit beta